MPSFGRGSTSLLFWSDLLFLVWCPFYERSAGFHMSTSMSARSYLAVGFTAVTAMSSCTHSPPSGVRLGGGAGVSMPVSAPWKRSAGVFSAAPYAPQPAVPNDAAPVYGPLSFGSSATRLSGGSSERTIGARTDAEGGYRLTDDEGKVTKLRPDDRGGYVATDSDGNVSRSRPDGFGGFRTMHEDGTMSRSRPDGFGGFVITDDDGNAIRLRSDGSGGYRGSDDAGNSYRIRRLPFE